MNPYAQWFLLLLLTGFGGFSQSNSHSFWAFIFADHMGSGASAGSVSGVSLLHSARIGDAEGVQAERAKPRDIRSTPFKMSWFIDFC